MRTRLIAFLLLAVCLGISAGCSNGGDDTKAAIPEPTGKPLPPGNHLGDLQRPGADTATPGQK
jgi:hypothetical protein